MVLRDRRARPRLSAPSSGPIRVHRWDDLAEDEPHERHAGARAVLPRAGKPPVPEARRLRWWPEQTVAIS